MSDVFHEHFALVRKTQPISYIWKNINNVIVAFIWTKGKYERSVHGPAHTTGVYRGISLTLFGKYKTNSEKAKPLVKTVKKTIALPPSTFKVSKREPCNKVERLLVSSQTNTVECLMKCNNSINIFTFRKSISYKAFQEGVLNNPPFFKTPV